MDKLQAFFVGGKLYLFHDRSEAETLARAYALPDTIDGPIGVTDRRAPEIEHAVDRLAAACQED